MTTITRTEPLPETLTHECEPAVCTPCDRCGHCDADHTGQAFPYELDECELPGCDCTKHLAAGDCAVCDGSGEIWFDVETRGGRVLDDMAPCTYCAGTGQTR